MMCQPGNMGFTFQPPVDFRQKNSITITRNTLILDGFGIRPHKPLAIFNPKFIALSNAFVLNLLNADLRFAEQ
jgi:hypothetical protein